MKKLVRTILKYTVIFEPAEEGGYIAGVPLLPGCATQGETFEETMTMVKDAILGYLTVLKEKGAEIPFEKEEAVVARVSIPEPVYFTP